MDLFIDSKTSANLLRKEADEVATEDVVMKD
jgi:hypothetical protein